MRRLAATSGRAHERTASAVPSEDLVTHGRRDIPRARGARHAHRLPGAAPLLLEVLARELQAEPQDLLQRRAGHLVAEVLLHFLEVLREALADGHPQQA